MRDKASIAIEGAATAAGATIVSHTSSRFVVEYLGYSIEVESKERSGVSGWAIRLDGIADDDVKKSPSAALRLAIKRVDARRKFVDAMHDGIAKALDVALAYQQSPASKNEIAGEEVVVAQFSVPLGATGWLSRKRAA